MFYIHKSQTNIELHVNLQAKTVNEEVTQTTANFTVPKLFALFNLSHTHVNEVVRRLSLSKSPQAILLIHIATLEQHIYTFEE